MTGSDRHGLPSSLSLAMVRPCDPSRWLKTAGDGVERVDFSAEFCASSEKSSLMGGNYDVRDTTVWPGEGQAVAHA